MHEILEEYGGVIVIVIVGLLVIFGLKEVLDYYLAVI